MGTLSNLMNYNNIARRMLAECKGSLDPCGSWSDDSSKPACRMALAGTFGSSYKPLPYMTLLSVIVL